ncbi:glycosyltransferase family 2 protein [Candidatus Woesearchaeota archaeon]|nr:glycosyltransferase family 2 protein [Candidatus Woesearchaeota archaeon]
MKNEKKTKKMLSQAPVTIVIPTHTAPVDAVVAAIKKQKYSGKVTIIVMDDGSLDRSSEMPKGIVYIHNEKNLGLARNMNKGLLLAKTEFVITLHQDCIPQGEDWLAHAMKPMVDSSVVLSSSQQLVPKEVWETFSFWHKVFSVPELRLQKTVHEHATVYRLSLLKKCGLFDGETYKTAGEDTDLFMKLRDYGQLVVNEGLVAHIHAPHNDSLWKFIQKVFMRDNEAMGVLHRKYGPAMGFQYMYDLLKTVLFFFFVIFLYYNVWVSLFLFLCIVFLANITHLSLPKYIQDIRLLFVPFVYTAVWFITLFSMWKGFVTGKQGWFNN